MYRVPFLLRRHKAFICDLHERGKHLTSCRTELKKPILFQQRVFAELAQVEKLRISIVSVCQDLLEGLYRVDCVSALCCRLGNDGITPGLDG